MKKKYIVGVREVYVSYREVEAESIEQAIEEAGDLGKEIFMEYAYTMDPDSWSVEEVKEDGSSELVS